MRRVTRVESVTDHLTGKIAVYEYYSERKHETSVVWRSGLPPVESTVDEDQGYVAMETFESEREAAARIQELVAQIQEKT